MKCDDIQMNNCGTQTIETQRLILRRITVEDAPAMYKNWASDPEVTKYLTWQPHASEDVTRMLLDSWAASYAKPNFYNWAITLKSNGAEPIGSIAAVSLNEDLGIAHIGYCLSRAFWHMGIMTEALGAVIRFFFDEVGAQRVESRHDSHNPHSGMVMLKCGMQYEGTLRRADKNNQGICDVCCYAILNPKFN